MNDDRSPLDPVDPVEPLDDELVSAVLDGEATPAERALVEGSPEGRRRLEELRRAARAVATPVAPLDEAATNGLVARALAEAPAPAVGRQPAPAEELATRRAARGTDRGRRVVAALAAAAAVVVLFVAVAGLARTGGRSDSASDAASQSSNTDAGGSAAGVAGGDATAEAAPQDTSGTAAPADLGVAADAEEVLVRYRALLAAEPAVDHQFDDLGDGALTSGAADARTVLPADAAACPLPPVTVAPGETWAVTAVATLPSGPVVVMADTAALPGGRTLVVDGLTCDVLAEGPS